MIYSYAVSQQGTYHVKHDIVCQDAFAKKIIGDRYAVCAVADGLGSELYTDIASKIAADSAVAYCAEQITLQDDASAILRIIKESFLHALARIRARAAKDGNDFNEYDTTLALAVFRNGTLFWGNAGDSGMVVCKTDGTYSPVTHQQRDENGCVFPLVFGDEKWEFGVTNDVATVLLATDGMYETLFPYLLKNEPVEIYVALARYLMDKDVLGYGIEDEASVQGKMESFLASIPGEQVSDDKTVAVLIDASVAVSAQPEAYYAVPDWKALKEKRDREFRKAAYPSLNY